MVLLGALAVQESEPTRNPLIWQVSCIPTIPQPYQMPIGSRLSLWIAARRTEGEHPARSIRLASHDGEVAITCRDVIGMSAEVGDIAGRYVRPDSRIRLGSPERGPRGKIKGSGQSLAGGYGVSVEGEAARHFRCHEAIRRIHRIVVAPAHDGRGHEVIVGRRAAAAVAAPAERVDGGLAISRSCRRGRVVGVIP